MSKECVAKIQVGDRLTFCIGGTDVYGTDVYGGWWLGRHYEKQYNFSYNFFTYEVVDITDAGFPVVGSNERQTFFDRTINSDVHSYRYESVITMEWWIHAIIKKSK